MFTSYRRGQGGVVRGGRVSAYGLLCGAREIGLCVPRCNEGIRGVISCLGAVRSEKGEGRRTETVVGIVRVLGPTIRLRRSFRRGL